MDIILDKGLDKLRLAEIAERCDMSTGHVLYYFKTKGRILTETLTWSEGRVTIARRTAIDAAAPGWPQMNVFVKRYLPAGPDDPNWSLWIEVWARRLHADFRDELIGIDRDAAADLEGILRLGHRAGAFRSPPRNFVERITALMDGLAVHILEGTMTRARALSLVREQCRSELGTAS
jgi:AcrR family transcriptional regulator